jgi:hypothetical protein
MDMLKFGMMCQKYNILYQERFGEVPTPADYACTREEYYAALVKSVESGCKIEKYLKRAVIPDWRRYEY